MGVNGKQRSTVIFHDLSVISSPGGDGALNFTPIVSGKALRFEDPFSGDNLCEGCGSAFNSDAHRSFVFFASPADIEHAPTTGGVASEWRPAAHGEPFIPGDGGPSRVAYWYENAPVVQVHDGDDHGFWVPCYSYTVTRDALPYSMWICRRSHVGDPCDEEFMRSIST